MKTSFTACLFFISVILFSYGEQIQFLLTGILDLNQLENYANQSIPDYINEDNTPNDNPINNSEATLGRVLFYDVNLSLDNTIACASCHRQAFAFGDPRTLSVGRTGDLTGRHSMRLINTRFAEEERFFWDERASSLEDQSTKPIQDHVEMGFSGGNGDPGIDSLFRKMADLDHYQKLFRFVYGDPQITERRLQRSLAQFIRSIQSFDSKYDDGRAQVNNGRAPFPNFTAAENRGKDLFMRSRNDGGANCQTCHGAPEFDIDEDSDNNGIIGVAGDPTAQDLTNTRAPSLRDLVNPAGNMNGPMMHNGIFTSLEQVINHYDRIPNNNPNMDRRLQANDGPGGNNQPQNLNLSDQEKQDLVAFLRTLTGNDVYTNPIWSDPFDIDGKLEVLIPCETTETTANIQLCEGESYTGDLTQVLTTADGCDSIVSFVLNYFPLTDDVYVEEECCASQCPSGYVSGTYITSLNDTNGCTYNEVLNLTVHEESIEIIESTLCQSESLIVNGTEYNSNNPSGTQVMASATGCDSTIHVSLTFVEDIEVDYQTSICEDETLVINGTAYNASHSSGQETFMTVAGCDSIVNVALSVIPILETVINQELCEGQGQAGSYTSVSESSLGCDSITILNISILPSSESYIQETCCEGQCAIDPGTYITTLSNLQGCDSTIVLEIVELPMASIQIDTSICQGEAYMGYQDAGTYDFQFVAANGCDSILTLELTVLDEVDCMTSTDNALESSVVIYPNPFYDQIIISSEDRATTYRLLGINGQVYMNGVTKGLKTILNTSGLYSGLYILELVDNENYQTTRKQVVKI